MKAPRPSAAGRSYLSLNKARFLERRVGAVLVDGLDGIPGMEVNLIFSLVVLLFSIIIHEVSHGYAALFLGDHTAEYEGRLTLNPLRHIDLIGTIILPLICVLSPGGFFFGWAKPVPYNPHNLRNQRWGEAIVAAAGPLSNILIALIFGMIVRFYDSSPAVFVLCQIIVLVNVTLAVFNLMPIPPLDGSKILSAVLPSGFLRVRQSIERFGFIGVVVFLVFIWQFFQPVIPWIFRLITGQGL
jgi:Zn-dependent protease